MHGAVRTLCLAVTLAFSNIAWAQESLLPIQVTDLQGRPISGVVLGSLGDTAPLSATDSSGKTQIQVPSGIKEGGEISLRLVRAKKGLILISPWNGRITVPSLEDRLQRPISIVLAKKGDRNLLRNTKVLTALVAELNELMAKGIEQRPTEERQQLALNEVAEKYGLKADEIDKAIRALAERTNDPYESALAALYLKNYPSATQSLSTYSRMQQDRLEREKSELAEANMLLGRALFVQARYEDAEKAYREALSLRPTDVAIIDELGRVLSRVRKYREAEALYKQSLAIKEGKFGANDPEVAKSLINLGELYYHQGEYDLAEQLYKRALEIARDSAEPVNSVVATSLNSLAVLYSDIGRNIEAEKLYKEALAIREREVGPESPDIAYSLNNLASLYFIAGKYPEAENLYHRALTILENTLGPQDLAVAQTLDNLASLYFSRGLNAKAITLLERSLKIREDKLGSENIDFARSLKNLAVLYLKENDHAKAESMLVRARTIYEKNLGAQTPDMAKVLDELATIYFTKGVYRKAESLYKEALTIREQSFGSQSPDVVASLNSIAGLYYKTSRYAEAKTLYLRALEISEGLGSENPSVATLLNNLAQIYIAQGMYSTAEPLLTRSLAIREKFLGPDHPAVASTLNNLAAIFEAKKQYSNAESLYKRSLAIQEKMLGKDHPDVASSLRNLAVLYREQGKYKESEQLFESALTIIEKTKLETVEATLILSDYALLLRTMKREAEAVKQEDRAKTLRAKLERRDPSLHEPPAVNTAVTTTVQQTVQNADGSWTVVEYPVGKEVIVSLTPSTTLPGAKGTAKIMRMANGTTINLDIAGLTEGVSNLNLYAVDPSGRLTLIGPVAVNHGVGTYSTTTTTPLDRFMLVLSPESNLTAYAPNTNVYLRTAVPVGYAVLPLSSHGERDGASVGERVAATTTSNTGPTYGAPMLGIPGFRRGTDTEMKINLTGAMTGSRANVFIEPRKDGPTTIKMRFHELKDAPAGKVYAVWAVSPDNKFVRLGQIVNTGQRNEAQIQTETALQDFGLLITVEDDSSTPTGTIVGTVVR